MADPTARPATPQSMVHRLPDLPDSNPDAGTKPDRFIVLITGSTAVAGKVQIAQTVATALECPLYQGDSLHETAAKAASVGASADGSGFNASRYRRMWLSKMTRTGLLFPEASHAAGAGFRGFGGGTSSTSTSRRGSVSSDASEASALASESGASSLASSVVGSAAQASSYINKSVLSMLSTSNVDQKPNPALLALTHPELTALQKKAIRECVQVYSIGVIFVPLDVKKAKKGLDEDEDHDLPILRPMDPRTMTSFGSIGPPRQSARNWSLEILLKVDVNATVLEIAEEIVDKTKEVMED